MSDLMSNVTVSGSIPSYVEDKGATAFETVVDGALGIAFLVTAAIAAKRMTWSRQQGGAEMTVVTAFHSLILLTSTLRAMFFLIPSSIWQPSYTPVAVMAFDPSHRSWVGAVLSEVLLTAGSLSLFSIFILILVFWTDVVKKYFYPGVRRLRPLATFFSLMALLVVLEVTNAALFLLKLYSSEAMILFNALLLSTVSMVCACKIIIPSHCFRAVLRRLGAINQVSTEPQLRRMVWITITGSLFFFTRAFLDALFAVSLLIFWHRYGTVQKIFSHELWDVYVFLKHWSELAILGLMLYILQSRFVMAAVTSGYEAVPENDAEPNEETNLIV